MADCLIIAGPPGTGTAGTEADNGGGTGAGTDAGTAGGTGGGAGAGTGAGTSCGTGLEPVGAKANGAGAGEPHASGELFYLQSNVKILSTIPY